MKQIKSLLLVALAVMMGGVYLVPASQVSAASSSSLSIVPKKNYVVKPGDSVHDTISIRNPDTDSPLNLTLRVIDFSYDGLGGTPKLMTDPNAPQTTWSLRPFMTVPKSVTIAPQATMQVPVDVAIPAGQGAGSYYSAILYSSGSGEGGNVGLSASIATLAFVNIPGKVKENLQVTNLGAYDRTTQEGGLSGYHYFNTKQPDTIGYTLQNNGNVTESPVGNITLRDIFGHTTTINNVNPAGSLALRGQKRTFTTCIKLRAEKVDLAGVASTSTTCDVSGLWPGHYSVSLDLFYGQNGNMTQELTKQAAFWYLPWWFILVSIIVLAAAFYYGRRAYYTIHDKFYGQTSSKKSSSRRRK